MAFTTLTNCAFPQNLDAASYALLQELSTRANNALNTLQTIATPDQLNNLNNLLDVGLDLINQALLIGDANATDLENAIGIPVDQPTSQQLEEYLSKAGVLVNGGLLFVPSSSGNIIPARRMYLSYSANYKKSLDSFSVGDNAPALFNIGIIETTVIPKQAVNRQLTIPEIRDYTKIDYIKDENVATLQDGRQLVVYRKFLEVNKSLDSVANSYGVLKTNISPSVFHYGAVDNSVPSIQRYQNLGYSGAALTAILSSADYQDVSSDPLSTSLKNAKLTATNIINSINFFLKSFDNQTPAGFETFRTNLNKDLNSLRESHQQVIAESYFHVTTITDKTVFSKLSSVQTESDLKILFIDRDDITGVNLDASDSEKMQIMQVSLADSVGSPRISNAYVNKQITTELYSKKILTEMLAFIFGAIDLNLDKKISNDKRYGQFFFSKDYLGKIKNLIVSYSEMDPKNVTAESGVVNTGYETYNSASGAIIQVINIDKTFNSQGKLDALEASSKNLYNYFPPAVAQVMLSILNFLKSLFSAAFSALKRLMDALRGPLMALKNKLDNFLSKLNALIGNGNLSVSILGCKLGPNISLSFNILDSLFALLNNLQNVFSEFLGKLLKYCTDLLDQIICYPAKLLASVLPPDVQGLPSLCSNGLSFTVQWPPDVTKALDDLKSIPDAYMVPFNGFSADLVKASISLNVFPEKLNQFKLASACETSLFGQFANSANLNFLASGIGASISNPLVGLQTSVFGPAGVLKGFGL